MSYHTFSLFQTIPKAKFTLSVSENYGIQLSEYVIGWILSHENDLLQAKQLIVMFMSYFKIFSKLNWNFS